MFYIRSFLHLTAAIYHNDDVYDDDGCGGGDYDDSGGVHISKLNSNLKRKKKKKICSNRLRVLCH